jgi:hypothetical protein
MESQAYVDKITLEYLGINMPNDLHTEQISIETEYVNFYKKRLYAAIKQHINALLKSPDGTNISSTDSILTTYIEKKIKEFRIDDFADLQNTDLSNSDNTDNVTDDVNILDVNSILYNNKPEPIPTLDDFVIKKKIITAPNYPRQKNIMNKNFRYKGVKKYEK